MAEESTTALRRQQTQLELLKKTTKKNRDLKTHGLFHSSYILSKNVLIVGISERRDACPAVLAGARRMIDY